MADRETSRLSELPATLIGRERELVRVENWWRSKTAILTVTGAPGIGKTLLARHACRRLDIMPTWFVIDADKDERHSQLVRWRTRLEALKEPFVVLDGAEPIHDLLIELFAERTTPTRILLTSSRALHVPFEERLTLSALSDEHAHTLFRCRCSAPLDADDVSSSIRRLINLLGNHPLAIELAAAHAESFGVAHTIASVESLLTAPDDASADPLERWSREIFERAWGAEEQRRVLAALSLFRGSFSIRALESMELDIRAFRELIRRSLVRIERPSDASHDEWRYRIEPWIRPRALLHLGDYDTSGALSRAWARGSIERARRERTSLDESRRESSPENLAAVVADRLERGDPDTALAALEEAGALAASQGAPRELAPLCERMLSSATSSSKRSRALHARARLRARWGDMLGLEEDLESALVASDLEERGSISLDLANHYRHQQRFVEAEAHFAAARDSAATRGVALLSEASMAFERSDLDHSAELFAAALVELRLRGDRRSEAIALQNYGLLLQERGELVAAREVFDRTLSIHRATRNRRYEGIGRFDLGGVALEEGRWERAFEEYEAARVIASELYERREEGLSTCMLGTTLALMDRVDEAAGLFERAGRILARLDQPAPLAALRIHEQQLELSRARARLLAGGAAHLPTLVVSEVAGDEVRFANRMVARATGALESLDGSLVVASDGSWLKPPRVPRVSLARQPTLRAILRRLAASESVETLALIRAGWPETRIASAPARNRLNVALSKLRRFGLEEFLVREESVYRLIATRV